MAIQNASDLLVYAKTTDPAKQVTRIRVLISDPIEVPDGGTQGNVKINNMTNGSGEVFDDVSTTNALNTGTDVLYRIKLALDAKDYDASTITADDGQGYTYRDFTNDANGIVPTLEIVSGTATLNDDAIIIEVLTPGSSAIFDPVAYSTSASFSTNVDLRDITTKDSDGWSESRVGLKSFEISTELLQSINPDVPLDGTDFFHELSERDEVNVSFSDRIRNKILTNLTQSGVDGFTKSNNLTQTNLQSDPFSGSTASKLTTRASVVSHHLGYTIDASRVENKKVNWSFYVKGVDANNREASFALSNSSIVGASTVTKIEGDGDIEFVTSSYYKITGLGYGGSGNENWTRISFQTDTINLSGSSALSFYIYPGLYTAQDSDEIFTSSWQIEFSPEATDYQDPTEITHWQGNALVSSVSFDAGVEDNLTCSATFTGTGNVYPNGLGPELISDTGFDNPSYWTVTGESVVENGYGKILFTAGGAISYITRNSLMTAGDFYLLTYTVSSGATPEGGIVVFDGWEQDGSDGQTEVPISVGTHEVLIKAGATYLQLKRRLTSIDTTVWLSSISLKKVL